MSLFELSHIAELPPITIDKINEMQKARIDEATLRMKAAGVNFYNEMVEMYGCNPDGTFQSENLNSASKKITEAVKLILQLNN